MLLVEHDHRVVDGDDADQPPFAIDHGGGDQVVLVEGVGHVGLGLIDGDDLERLLLDVGQLHVAARPHHLSQRHVAHRVQPRVDQSDVVELLRQVVLRHPAQMVDRLAHGPVFRRHHQLALHQPAGGVFRVAQRQSHGVPVGLAERAEDRGLLMLLEILDQVDDVVAVQLAHGVGQHFGMQDADDLLADRLVELRQDVAVELLAVEPDQARAVVGRHLFQKVGDVGGVQRLHQFDEPVAIVDLDGVEDGRDDLGIQGIVIPGFFLPLQDLRVFYHRLSPVLQARP